METLDLFLKHLLDLSSFLPSLLIDLIKFVEDFRNTLKVDLSIYDHVGDQGH